MAAAVAVAAAASAAAAAASAWAATEAASMAATTAAAVATATATAINKTHTFCEADTHTGMLASLLAPHLPHNLIRLAAQWSKALIYVTAMCSDSALALLVTLSAGSR